MAYAQDRDEYYYTEQLVTDFVHEFFNITQGNFRKALPQAQIQELHVIRVIGDFQMHQAILQRYLKHRQILIDPIFMETSRRFQEFCVAKEYSNVTLDHYVKQSAYFMDYMAAQGFGKGNP